MMNPAITEWLQLSRPLCFLNELGRCGLAKGTFPAQILGGKKRAKDLPEWDWGVSGLAGQCAINDFDK